MDILYIVIPCYNEEEVLNETYKRMNKKMNSLMKNKIINKNSRVVFVDDGSKDKTWDLIKKFNKENDMFIGVKLSRNKGHQNALLAGLLYSKEYADMIISMDADLQDDIDAIDSFVKKYKEGNDIVYGVRKERKKDTFFKRNTALLFYKIMKFLGVDIIYNHADYRLMSKRSVENLASFDEVNLFLRGIVPLIGYKYDVVYYDRDERFAGVSKYPLKKMVKFALDGITSFSVKPIRMIFNLGLAITFLSFVMILYALIGKIVGSNITGWTFITISIWLIGGIQMLALGIIGEYIGKIYSETKKRPKYFIDEVLK